jgi:hypothetical protein
LHLNFTEDRFPIHLFPFVNFYNDLAQFHKPVTSKSQERNTYNVAVFITFNGKAHKKNLRTAFGFNNGPLVMSYKQIAIKSDLTLLCHQDAVHQKTMNWKDMALWFCQRKCMYLLPYYESNQKQIQSEEIRSEHLCHSW